MIANTKQQTMVLPYNPIRILALELKALKEVEDIAAAINNLE